MRSAAPTRAPPFKKSRISVPPAQQVTRARAFISTNLTRSQLKSCFKSEGKGGEGGWGGDGKDAAEKRICPPKVKCPQIFRLDHLLVCLLWHILLPPRFFLVKLDFQVGAGNNESEVPEVGLQVSRLFLAPLLFPLPAPLSLPLHLAGDTAFVPAANNPPPPLATYALFVRGLRLMDAHPAAVCILIFALALFLMAVRSTGWNSFTAGRMAGGGRVRRWLAAAARCGALIGGEDADAGRGPPHLRAERKLRNNTAKENQLYEEVPADVITYIILT